MRRAATLLVVLGLVFLVLGILAPPSSRLELVLAGSALAASGCFAMCAIQLGEALDLLAEGS